jgi:FkbM family methyltransferase
MQYSIYFATMVSVYFFQIGSHVGNTINDHIFSEEITDKHLVLIEPVRYYFQKLQENYADKARSNHITFLNVAISNQNSTLDLYVPSLDNDFSLFPPWASQLSSCVESHIPTHCPNLKTEKITVPCYRIGTIIDNMKIQHIEYLLVDTEGHDYDILMDLDLTVVKPVHIIFENKHMDGVCCRGPKYHELMTRFTEAGYRVFSEDGEDTHIVLAVSEV